MAETSIGEGALVPFVKADSPHETSDGGESISGDKDFLCPICMQIIKDAFLTACGHSYCYMCIFTHLRNKSDCPCCSRFLTPKLIFPNFALDKVRRCNRLSVFCSLSEIWAFLCWNLMIFWDFLADWVKCILKNWNRLILTAKCCGYWLIVRALLFYAKLKFEFWYLTAILSLVFGRNYVGSLLLNFGCFVRFGCSWVKCVLKSHDLWW